MPDVFLSMGRKERRQHAEDKYCGTVHCPIHRVCTTCRAKDDFEKEIAKNFKDDCIVIRGIGLAADPELHLFRANHDYLHWPSTAAAAKQAYEQARIKNPFKEIDIVQLHDCFTITELLSYEDLGLCRKGEAKDLVHSGVFELGSELTVNTDGGLKSFGHPVGASGIRMIYEIYKQMQGKAEPRRLKKIPEVGLAHNIGGAPFVAVVILHNRI